MAAAWAVGKHAGQRRRRAWPPTFFARGGAHSARRPLGFRVAARCDEPRAARADVELVVHHARHGTHRIAARATRCGGGAGAARGHGPRARRNTSLALLGSPAYTRTGCTGAQ